MKVRGSAGLYHESLHVVGRTSSGVAIATSTCIAGAAASADVSNLTTTGGSSTRTFLSWPAWMLKRSNRAFCSATCFWPWGSLGQMFKTEEFNSDDDDEYSCSYNLFLGTRL